MGLQKIIGKTIKKIKTMFYIVCIVIFLSLIGDLFSDFYSRVRARDLDNKVVSKWDIKHQYKYYSFSL